MRMPKTDAPETKADSFAIRCCLDQIDSIREEMSLAGEALQTIAALQQDAPPADLGAVVSTVGKHLARLDADLENHLDWLSSKATLPQLPVAEGGV